MSPQRPCRTERASASVRLPAACLVIAMLLSGATGTARATLLNFAGHAQTSLSQTYGDNVAGSPSGGYAFTEAGEGWTPNVVQGNANVSVWTSSGYGTLPAPTAYNSTTTASIYFQADAGYKVKLLDFGIAGWGAQTLTYVRVLAADGTTELARTNSVALGTKYMVADFGWSTFSDTKLTIQFSGSAGYIGIDNIRIAQESVVPTPSIVTQPPTSIGPTSARLNGNLSSLGTPPQDTDVYVYWGAAPGDQPTPPAQGTWDHATHVGTKTATGAVYYDAAGLTRGQRYYYRFVAQNGAGTTWASVTANFVAGIAQAEELVADLDMSSFGGAVWTNYAAGASSVGNFDTAGTKTDGSASSPVYTTPSPGTIAGASGVIFVDNTTRMISANIVPVTITGNSSWSVEYWEYNPAVASEEYVVGWFNTWGAHGSMAAFGVGSSATTGAAQHWFSHMGYTAVPTAGAWHHIVHTFDGATEKVYVDGALDTQRSTNLVLGAQTMILGTDWDWDANVLNGSDFSGYLAQVRVHGGALTADEIIQNHDTHAAVYGHDLIVVPTPRIAALPATGVTTVGATLNGNLTSLGTPPSDTEVYVYWGTTQGDQPTPPAQGTWDHVTSLGTKTSTGSVAAPLGGLNNGQLYCYRFAAQNGAGVAWSAVGLVVPHTVSAISGGVLWLRADLGVTTVGGAGTDVTRWDDVIGNGHYAEGTTYPANRPVLNAAGLNGLPTIDFTAANDDWLYMDATTYGFQHTFIVYKDNSTAGYVTPLGTPYVSGAAFHGAAGAGGTFDATHTLAATRDGNNYRNGDSMGNGTATPRPSADYEIREYQATAPFTSTYRLQWLGRDQYDANRDINGGIAEIILYNRPLTTIERNQIGAYLKQRYGITASYTVATPTTTALDGPWTVTYGQQASLTATVSPTPDGGTVQFYDNGLALGSPVAVNTGDGTAQLSTSASLGAGSHPITAIFSGTENFASSTASSQTLTVDPRGLTVTADNDIKTFGFTKSYGPGATAFTSVGLQNGETIGSVTLSDPNGGGLAGAAVGDYPLVPSAATGGTFNPANYAISYVNGTLTVVPAGVATTTTLDGPWTVAYGEQAVLTATVNPVPSSGTVQFKDNGVNLGSPVAVNTGNGTAQFTTSASLAAGSHPITAEFGGASGFNPSTSDSATLTVSPRALSVQANDDYKLLGTARTYPIVGSTAFTPTGLQNGETIGSVTVSDPSNGGAAGAAAGTYPLVPSAATGGTFNPANYSITYVNGTLTVLPYTWGKTAPGTYAWNTGANWLPNTGFPNGANVPAYLNVDIAGDQTIELNQAITIGEFRLGDTSGTSAMTIAAGTGGSLSGVRRLQKTGSGNATISANISLSGDVFGGCEGGTLTISGVLGGSYYWPDVGPGTIELTNPANTFNGGWGLGIGGYVTVSVPQISCLGPYGKTFFWSGGGTLKYTGTGETMSKEIASYGATPTLAALDQSGTGNLTFTGAFTLGTQTLVLQGSTSGTGEIAASLGASVAKLRKEGSGKWTLAAANSYTGTTTINGGTLALGASGSIAASSAISIAAGATLDTTAKASYALPATQPITLGIDPAGSGTAGRINAQQLNITNGHLTLSLAGTLDDPVYVLAGYTSLTGTQFASVTGVPPRYSLLYDYNGGTQIALVGPAAATVILFR